MSIKNHISILLAGLALAAGVHAGGPLDALTDKEAGGGLKAALEAGSVAAVGKLGVEGGGRDDFMTSPAGPARA